MNEFEEDEETLDRNEFLQECADELRVSGRNVSSFTLHSVQDEYDWHQCVDFMQDGYQEKTQAELDEL